MYSFMMRNAQQICLSRQIKEDEMSGICVAYGVEEKYLQRFDGET
jgi:hypothetical protein